VPTLAGFGATEYADQVNRDQHCSGYSNGVTYTLGCYQQGGPPTDGIIWRATAQIPALNYLSDPAESGIKFVQAVSMYRKRLKDGNIQCFTARTAQSAGWQLDTRDPYDWTTIHYFSEGNRLDMGDNDPPGAHLEGTVNNVFFSEDARFISDNFETYVFYFTTDPSNRDEEHPIFQRVMNLSGSTHAYAAMRWSWGGQVLFNYYSVPQSLLFTLQSNTVPGTINASEIDDIKPMTTIAPTSLGWVPCPGATVTSNPIDGSRFYVTQLYWDFFNRAPDQSGLNFWRSNITQCGFDTSCIGGSDPLPGGKRVDLARAFFYSTEFIGMHPALGGQRGTHDYNWSFVYWCYRTFLQREPNAPPDNNWNGFNYWVGVLDSTNPDAGDYKYNQVIKAFITSTEYRGRFGPP